MVKEFPIKELHFKEVKEFFLTKSVVCVIHADKIPPHLGLISEGLFFSAKANSADVKIPLTQLLYLFQSKSIPVLFYQLNSKYNWTIDFLSGVFSGYRQGLKDTQTCLTPILEIIRPNMKCEVVTDLIGYLEKEKGIEEVYGMNLSPSFKGIPIYNRDEIEQRINYLKGVKSDHRK